MKRKLLIFNHRGTCRDLQQFIKIRNRIAFSLREALKELEEMEIDDSLAVKFKEILSKRIFRQFEDEFVADETSPLHIARETRRRLRFDAMIRGTAAMCTV